MCCKNCCSCKSSVNPELAEKIAKMVDEKLSGESKPESHVNKKLKATLGKFLNDLLAKDWGELDHLKSLKVDVVIFKDKFGLVNFQENFGASRDDLQK